jgi:hypothetical protein
MGNIGKILTSSENIAHNQAMVAGEHVLKMTDKVDHSVVEAENLPGEGNAIFGDGKGNPYHGNPKNKEKKQNKRNEPDDINIDPTLGHFIDIRE